MPTTEPSVNGDSTAQPEVKPKKKRKKLQAAEARAMGPAAKPVEPETRGRLASDLVPQTVEWLIKPWIPRALLSVVVGMPNIGKSTFMAWLLGIAKSAAILPGFEEVPEVTTLPRLKAHKVLLESVRFLDDRPYFLPRDKVRIANILTGWEADLLVIDPIDSYMDEDLNENVGRDVRTFLESAAWIARETGAAVVGVRHPGKDRTNVMPGSRQWRAVPRMIVELIEDSSVPPKKFIRHFRDGLGQDARPREYVLQGERGKPRVFKLLGEMDDALNTLSTSAGDPACRLKVRLAGQVLRHMMESETECFAEDYMARLQAQSIGGSAGYEARRLCGIFSIPSGSGAKWVMKRADVPWPKWTDLDAK